MNSILSSLKCSMFLHKKQLTPLWVLLPQLAGAKFRAWEDESAQRASERRALRQRLESALGTLQHDELDSCKVKTFNMNATLVKEPHPIRGERGAAVSF